MDFDFFWRESDAADDEATLSGTADGFFLLGSASSDGSLVSFFCFFFFALAFCTLAAAFFLSIFATASASQAAFNFPRPAGRLLRHSADRSSPAISAIFRLVNTD